MRFFTSDQHFGHANILKYEHEQRRDQFGNPFPDVSAMNEFLINRWNAIVSDQDTVYCLGDMSFNLQVLRDTLPRLAGNKILIVGNHDPFFKLAVSGKLEQARERAQEIGFADLHNELRLELDSVGEVLLSHFPYYPSQPELQPEHNLRYPDLRPTRGGETVLLHGHVHSQWQFIDEKSRPIMINVGVDVWKMRPVSESDIAISMSGDDGAWETWDKVFDSLNDDFRS